MPRAFLAAVILGALALLAAADDVDLEATLRPSFSDVALLPTRLTAYNQHDDAAQASYTCCRVRQERQIKAAIVANMAFLNRFWDTSFADHTYIHYGRVASFLPDSFRNQEWAFRSLVELYPDSDLADDACMHLANLYRQDGQHESAIKVLEYMAKKWPESTWADDALFALVQEYAWVENNAAALDALNQLAYQYPKSEFCVQALNALSQRYAEIQDYDSAINAAEDLIRDFPNSDLADDAQMRIAECLRHKGDLRGAVEAYCKLIDQWYGSDLTNQAMREANTLMRQIRGAGRVIAGEMYDTEAWNPAKDAKDLWDAAKHLQNNGNHSAAVAKFREFIEKFEGNDLWDDAWYQIGLTYLRQDQLFQEINAANGPEDLDRLAEDYQASTGQTGPIPADGKLSSLENAREAFAYIANNLKGSSLQCEALGMVARCFIKYGDIEAEPPPDAAYTFQEIVIHFPYASCRPVFFADAAWPVYALCRLIDFYANPANWEYAQQMYPALAAEYPGVFPVGLEQDKDAFYELMRLYQLKVDHAYMEMEHHIPYALSVSDLLPDSRYFRAAMLMDRGDYAQARDILQPLIQLRGQELVAPATYLYAQASARVGDWDAARAAFTGLVENHKNSGLADDAQKLWEQYTDMAANPAKYDISATVADVQARYGINAANMDVYIGEHCTVFCPFTRAAMMRMYNMPNIWDEAQRILRDWAGLSPDEKVTIVVDHGGESTYGNPFKVPGLQIKDPPDWGLGLQQIAANVLAQGIPNLAENHDLLDGIAYFVASSLQYDLVTETRDAIGSAAAVKLPQEQVINARNGALKALENYVVAGEDAPLTREVIAGMMYSLLDSQGFSKDRLIDREPYRAFFAKLKEVPAKTAGGQAFSIAVVSTFGENCSQQLKDWRLPVPSATVSSGETQIGMLR